jgi:hypothetical protein
LYRWDWNKERIYTAERLPRALPCKKREQISNQEQIGQTEKERVGQEMADGISAGKNE